MSFQLPLRNCGRCRHWQRSMPAPCDTNGVLECCCEMDQRGHDRDLNQDWMVGSDHCSKWEARPA